ncbi:malate dehydrogenase (oxaloacetate-decarboxylating) [Hydrogenispora ethanolica]|jgi:malate dehydrogenase (oxaloacetate-decarboxylating)|uniref:Malate dehydrogenase (Oxaloacetate-decarboxylating) n=1 Tax=Hydrogenispora ethanolica TaxID=1082276 RepID=A0A4R1QXK3_HYDET|nr:malic enzyme-like NAD(P)-binding protein [Hydrogenispora ethanolica]TCL55840.1 malate dehydrogenase (oxaloacetate-decarboxylating) [Hydrogenispora ethanolica]
MELREAALHLHRVNRGKIAVAPKVPIRDAADLSLAYSPGVAEPCKEIARDPDLVYDYTNRGNMVAVVSDGTAVLGLGDIGPLAGLPVMEGKAVLFKQFADIDAVPICLATKEIRQLVETVRLLEPTFGGINLEDISGPRCFEVEEQLKAAMNIPVFHDDQHGTAVVCCAGLLNALKVAGKEPSEVRVVVNGAGAAGIAITKMLLQIGITPTRLRLCDKAGILSPDDPGINHYQAELARLTNPTGQKGDLSAALTGADVFIGVSAPNIVTPTMVQSMNERAIIFGMANPIPEIMPELAHAVGALIVGTGRSDLPNQINNLIGFPGIFRGALDVRASTINEPMKVAAVRAIAALVPERELDPTHIIPNPFDRRVVPAVAFAVAEAAMATGVARTPQTREALETAWRQRGIL